MESILEMYSAEDQQEMKKLYEIDYMKPTNTKLWGYSFLPGFCTESARYAYEDWEIPNRDVIVASYPKTGKLCNLKTLTFFEFCKNKKLLKKFFFTLVTTILVLLVCHFADFGIRCERVHCIYIN